MVTVSRAERAPWVIGDDELDENMLGWPAR
jgi:hypothetical protein